jgi:uncharacterized OB-fold protein
MFGRSRARQRGSAQPDKAGKGDGSRATRSLIRGGRDKDRGLYCPECGARLEPHEQYCPECNVLQKPI